MSQATSADATRDAAIASTAQLSFAQERIWFLEQLEPGSAANHCSTILELTGSVNVTHLEQCVNEIIRRHEALRTRFVGRDGRPVQAIEETMTIVVRVVDLRVVAASDLAIRRFVTEESLRPFALDRLPLIRLTLYRRDAARYILQLTTHHIVWDAWSAGVFLQDLLELYEDYGCGRPSGLAELAVRYRGFAEAERQSIETPRGQQDLAYWKGRLRELGPLRLPTDSPRPAVRTFEGRSHTFELDRERWESIEAYCAERHASPFMFFMGALRVYLALLSGERRIAVGVPIANRARPEWQGLIGLFMNVLVFQDELAPGEPYDDVLARTRDEALGAYAHAELPFAKLVDELNPVRSLTASPLFEVMLVYLNTPMPKLAVPGLTASLWYVDSVTAKQDLALTISARDGRFLGAWEYNSGLFQASTIERFSRQFVRVIEALVERGSVSPALLRDADDHARSNRWNATERPDWLGGTLDELRLLEQPSDRVALVCGEQQITFGRLRAQAMAWADRLTRCGVGADTPVGIVMPRGPELLIGMLAVWTAGGAYVPIDERWPRRRMAQAVSASGIELVLTTEATRAAVADLGVRALEVTADRLEPAGPVRRSGVAPSNRGYIIFTSGSTGQPKGIEVPREAVSNLLRSMAERLNAVADDVFLAVTATSFDIAVLEWALPLMSGGRVVLLSHEQVRDPRELQSAITRHQPTHLQATPTLWRMLLDDRWTGDAQLTALAGGEALDGSLARQLGARCRDLWNVYGPTETTIWSMAGPVSGETPDLGEPLGNTAIHLVTPRLEPVPIGFEGEIGISGAGVCRGYVNQPALTAEKFLPDPFSATPGTRMFRTGDLARWGWDGRLRFTARADGQLKVRGLRVEPGEIEGCMRLHSAVRDAAVSLRGEGRESRLVAYVVLQPSLAGGRHDGITREIARLLRERLPEHMVPALFVILDALPLTTSGKIDRHALPAAAAPSDPAVADDELAWSPAEEDARIAWQRALARERIRGADNFFDLGGNSILAAHVCLSLTTVLGVRVPVRLMFECPVFERFATRLAELRGGESSDLLPAIAPDPENRFAPFPLTDVQQAYLLGRSGVFELGDVSTHSYFEIESAVIDVDRFEAAWRRLVRRHDMLRAVFSMDGSQRVLREVPDYTVGREDVSTLAPAARDGRLLAIRNEMSHAVHRADRWPLFEIRATRVAPELTRFHFSIDALIGDAFSSALLAREWLACYRDPACELPAVDLTFRDYVTGIQALESTEIYRRSERYWMDRLDPFLRGPELPVVHGRREGSARFGRRSLRLSRPLWHTLKAAARQRGLSPTTVALTALGEILAYWSRTKKFLLNVTLFNRLPLHADVSRIVGDFTSITLLELDASTAVSFEAFAAATQRRLWDDLDHRFFSGLRVLRGLKRRSGAGSEIVAPVVFTSTLGFDATEESTEEWAREVFSLSQTPQVWLDQKVFEQRGELGVDWDFAEALFPDGVIDAMFEAYRRLLETLAERDDAWLTERRALHRSIVGAAAAGAAVVRFEGADTLHDLFLEQARRTPERVAVVARDRTLTYGELDSWSGAYAAELAAQSIQPEELVAVVAPKGWEQSVGVLGVVRAGAAYLPIEPTEPEDRRLRMLRAGRVRCALTTPALARSLVWPEMCRPIPVVPSESWRPLPSAAISGTRLAYVIYTSGSTGQPKGVMIEHASAVNTLRDLARRLDLGPEDRTIALSALSFDLSVFDAFGMWSVGGAVVYPDPARPKDPEHWSALLRSERVTIWNTVPGLMEMLIEATPVREAALRWVLLSGDWIPVGLPPRIRQRWPAACQLSLGGATEASIWSILHPIDRVDPAWTRIPYGRAMSNQSVVVLHETMEQTPTWVVGEMFIGGAGLARGYLGDPDLTARRFVTHPESGERLYRTGDLGRYLPNGEIDILGRADHQVKVNGYRVELPEIEAVLEQEPSIQQAVVNLDADESGRKELVAYLVERSATEPGPMRSDAVTFKLAQHAIREFPSDVAMVPLEDRRTADERQRTIARQSYRFFTEAPASLTTVDDWLTTVDRRMADDRAAPGPRSLEWFEALVSALRQQRLPGYPLPKRQYASAGSLYPVQTYFGIPADSIDGIAAGQYYYDPRAHRLVRVGAGSYTPGAPPQMLFVAELSAIESVYHDASMRFCALEAGYMRALFGSASLRPIGSSDGFRWSPSQHVIAAYQLDATAAVATPGPRIGPLLIWAKSSGLHGAEAGFYRREPGGPIVRCADAGRVDPDWFGPNRALVDRSHFALVAAAPRATHESWLDAGALGQLLMEESTAFDLGLCPIGEIADRFLEAAHVSGSIVHGWVGGRIDPIQTQTWMATPPTLDRAAVRQRCRDRVSRQLPSYMHPVRYVFVDALPLGANHKVDRVKLRTIAPSDERANAASQLAEGSEVERALATMLEGVLNRPVTDLGQSFFEMGADSLIIIRLYKALDERYPDRVTFQDLFDHPSVRGVARLIDEPAQSRAAAAAEVIEI